MPSLDDLLELVTGDSRNAARARISGAVLRATLRVHALIYERTDGLIGHRLLGVPCLMLRTTGRRSGRPRTSALVYARDGDRYAVVASKGGDPRSPAWLLNLRAKPDAQVQIGRARSPVLATEIVCVLRYTMHAVTATGISSEGVKDEFATHAKEEQEHAMEVAERINQLGGKPDFNPSNLTSKSASEYGTAGTLVDMIKENLIAERIAVEHYRELVRYFGERDPSTRLMMERILTVEEEHANDMHDLLVAHEGRPMLPG